MQYVGPYYTSKVVRVYDRRLILVSLALKFGLLLFIILKFFGGHEYARNEPVVSAPSIFFRPPPAMDQFAQAVQMDPNLGMEPFSATLERQLPNFSAALNMNQLPARCQPGGVDQELVVFPDCYGQADEYIPARVAHTTCEGLPCTCGWARNRIDFLKANNPAKGCAILSRLAHLPWEGGSTGLASVATISVKNAFNCDPRPGMTDAKNVECMPLPSAANDTASVTLGVDETVVNIELSYSTSFETGMNPPVDIYNHMGELVHSEPGGQLISSLTIRQLLGWAGIDLDDKGAYGGWPSEWLPSVRYLGAEVQLEARYSNLRPFDPDRSTRVKLFVRPQTNTFAFLERRIVYTGYRPTTNQPSAGYMLSTVGVRVRVITTGELGEFDWSAALLSAIAATVLLGAAAAITDMVALYLLPEGLGFRAVKWDTHASLPDVEASGAGERHLHRMRKVRASFTHQVVDSPSWGVATRTKGDKRKETVELPRARLVGASEAARATSAEDVNVEGVVDQP